MIWRLYLQIMKKKKVLKGEMQVCLQSCQRKMIGSLGFHFELSVGSIDSTKKPIYNCTSPLLKKIQLICYRPVVLLM